MDIDQKVGTHALPVGYLGSVLGTKHHWECPSMVQKRNTEVTLVLSHFSCGICTQLALLNQKSNTWLWCLGTQKIMLLEFCSMHVWERGGWQGGGAEGWRCWSSAGKEDAFAPEPKEHFLLTVS